MTDREPAVRVGGRQADGLGGRGGERATTARRGKGRTAQAPRRAGAAERWSSTRSGRKTEEIQCLLLLLLGSTYRATQFPLGLARSRRRGLIAACRNIARRPHRPHASLCTVIAPRLGQQASTATCDGRPQSPRAAVVRWCGAVGVLLGGWGEQIAMES